MPQPPGLSGFSNLFCTAPVGRPAGVGGASGRWRPQAPDEATLARNVDAWTRTHGSAPPWATFVDARWSEANETLDEANVLLAAGAHPDAEVVIVIGAGNGAILEAIEMQSPSACAVVLEPDAAAAVAWLSRRDWSDRIAASRLLALTGPAYAGAALLGKRYGSLAQAPVIVHPWLLQHRPDDVARARQALRQVTFESDANAQARRALAARYLLQTLGNAPRIAREGNAAALAGLFPGMPAVVVAAGPSLDRNIHDLAVVKDRAIVIACDTAARPLTSVGVEPDLIVASDPSRANAGHLSSLPIARAFLVAEGSLHGSAFAQADGRTFIFRVADHQPWPWLDSLGCERARIATWGSVATTAFSTAMALGCNPIVFIGADFAFTDERPYCRGTSFEPVWASWIAGGKSIAEIWKFLVERWPLEPAIDVNGNPVRTARHLVSFRDWIVERAAERPDRRIVNATAAGILAGPAIVQATAATTLAVHQPVDRDAILAALKRAHRASRGDAARLFEGVAAILSDPAAAAVDDWTAFADGIDRRAIEAALRSPEFQAWTLGARAGGSKERS